MWRVYKPYFTDVYTKKGWEKCGRKKNEIKRHLVSHQNSLRHFQVIVPDQIQNSS
jgi:hypothetical protein